jgi:hypothetical protein
MSGVCTTGKFDVSAHSVVVDEVADVAADEVEPAEVVKEPAVSVKLAVVRLSVPLPIVIDDVAYVTVAVPTVYVPVFDPSNGSFSIIHSSPPYPEPNCTAAEM